MADSELVEKIRYEADISDITQKMRTMADRQDALATDTDRHVGRMSRSWDGFRRMVGTGATWFAGIAAGAAILGPKLLDSGASLEALDRKAATVFSGSSLSSVQSWASKVAGSFGVTRSQAIAMATSMGDLFKPMGFTAAQAAGMATELGDLSGALSAWTGGTRSAADVADVITKAMLGERDGLKELGISISEADVQARLAANGQSKLTGSALEQAKALATMQLIQEKSTDAQKAWADGSMDGIKASNASKASLRQLGETVTRMLYPVLEKLLPIVQRVADWLGERLPGALRTAGKFISDVIGGGKKLIEDLANAFGVSEKTIGIVLGSIAGALVLVALAWNAGPGLIVTGIAALVAGFLWAYNNVEWFRTGVQTAFSLIKTYIDVMFITPIKAVITAIGWLWEKSEGFRGFIAGVFKVGIGIGKTAFEGIRDAIGWVFDKVGWLWDKLEPFRAFVAGAFNAGIGVGKAAFEGIRDAAVGVWEKLQPVIDALKTIITKAQEAWDWVQKINPFGGTSLATEAAKKSAAKKSGTSAASPDGTRSKHTGGIVSGMPGTQVLHWLLPGERVLTETDQRNTSGRSIVIEQLNVTTSDQPRAWFDEALWRVA